MQRFGIKWTPTFLVLDAGGKEHHRFVGYVPVDDLFANLGLGKAKVLFDSDRLEEAMAQFQTVIDRHPEAGATPEAVFLLGVAGYKHTHDPKELRRAYENLKARYPQSEWARRAEPYSAIPL
jgi:outer membrane protein assembly factor BamD (BamD/ComL family)